MTSILKNTEDTSREIYRSDFAKHSPSGLATISNCYNQGKLGLSLSDSYTYQQVTFIHLEFEVTHKRTTKT